MSIRRAALLALALCVAGGLIAGLFSSSIQAALTLPTTHQLIHPATTCVGALQCAHTPASTPAPTPSLLPATATSTPLPGWMSVLAQDTFQRSNQSLWGLASDGQMWSGDANSSPVFTIAANQGIVTGGQGIFNAILGQQNTNTEAVLSASVSHFESGVNIGAVLRWTDTNNWYKALIDGSRLVIMKRVNGVTTTLGQVPFTAHDGTSYSIRFRVIGASLSAKAWPSAQPEPPNWILSVIDTSLPAGFGGMRIALQPAVVVKVTSFIDIAITDMS